MVATFKAVRYQKMFGLVRACDMVKPNQHGYHRQAQKGASFVTEGEALNWIESK